jgi:hypothetical protein
MMFERLTNRTEGGIAYTKIPANPSNIIDVGECYTGRIIDRLAAYEDSGLSPEEVQKLKKSDASKEQCTIDQHGEIHRLRDELKRYKQAEQEGRLYNLPLKPGDTIYRPEALQFCWVIANVEIYEDEIVFIDDSDNIFRPDDIGKTVFLTREDAEKALEGMKG